MKKDQKVEVTKTKKTKAKKVKNSDVDLNIDAHSEKLLKSEQEKKEFQDKFIRLYSEYENFRKRTAKEKIDIINNAGERVISDLLPILDDFDRAIKNNVDINDASTIKEGFNLIRSKLMAILQQKGLKPMESKETTFDVDLHEAITNIPAPSSELKGKVVDVVEKGYYLNDNVIRFAKVVVGQ